MGIEPIGGAKKRALSCASHNQAGDVETRGKYVNLDVAERVRAGHIPPVNAESGDPERLIPAFVRPEWISIIVAGNPKSFWQRGYMNNHAQGAPVTTIVRY